MPILVEINATCNSGSTGRIAEHIALLAETKGWDCYIAHGARYVNKSKLKTIRIGNKIENYFHAFLSICFDLHGYGSTIGTLLLVKRLKEIQPDIVHLHNIHGYYINNNILFNYLAKSGIPVVWTLHDCWAFTGHCFHFENIGCYKWENGCNDCPLRTIQYKSIFSDRSKKNYEKKRRLYKKQNNLTIVPVSNWLARCVKDSMLKDQKIKTIRNGIDLEKFKPTPNDIKNKLNINNNKKLILCVIASRLRGKGCKGMEFKELARISSYQLLIVGLSTSDRKKLPSNIIFIRRTNNQEELAEYYSAADVFVNPTYDDTFPTTNIESLACGTPVVTYRAGGSPETIDDSTGIAVERGDINGFLHAVNTILSNGKRKYSDSCRERAVKNFNKDVCFNNYINLYEELIISG